MLSFHSQLKVFLATAPCDLRMNFNGLWTEAPHRLGYTFSSPRWLHFCECSRFAVKRRFALANRSGTAKRVGSPDSDGAFSLVNHSPNSLCILIKSCPKKCGPKYTSHRGSLRFRPSRSCSNASPTNRSRPLRLIIPLPLTKRVSHPLSYFQGFIFPGTFLLLFR